MAERNICVSFTNFGAGKGNGWKLRFISSEEDGRNPDYGEWIRATILSKSQQQFDIACTWRI